MSSLIVSSTDSKKEQQSSKDNDNVKLPDRLRFVTFNICGIRNVLQYHPWNEEKSFAAMFDLLKADIICFQETKIQRKDVDADMAIVPGFESFFSFSKVKRGYSGVAIYTRNSICRPCRAEEGITGILDAPLSGGKKYRELPNCIGAYDESLGESEARLLDNEGRTLILDLDAFILIGVYCPANSATADRDAYRAAFLTALFTRVRRLIEEEKREVILMGDLNICRDKIDTVEADERMIEEGLQDFKATYARQLLDELLVPHPNGVMVDLCREQFPDREGMFTCWNQKLNARPGNYGSRIDYILASKGLSSFFENADIRPDLLGSDHCPVYADLRLSSSEMTKTSSGGFRDKIMAVPSSTPKLASKFLPEFNGRRSIKEMFAAAGLKKSSSLTESKSETKQEDCLQSSDRIEASSTPAVTEKSLPMESMSRDNEAQSLEDDERLAWECHKAMMAELELESSSNKPANLRASERNSGDTVTSTININRDWRKIFEKPKPPNCSGHNEPCIQMTTKKAGINQGRAFWICARPIGPGYERNGRSRANTNREFRCSYFKWCT
ncbi:DNA-lyase 2 [Dipodascopsis uninucleata]